LHAACDALITLIPPRYKESRNTKTYSNGNKCQTNLAGIEVERLKDDGICFEVAKEDTEECKKEEESVSMRGREIDLFKVCSHVLWR